jgi:predicted porin
MGVAGTSANAAPTGLDFAGPSTALGVEWHSAADFLMDGLKMSASFSSDSGAAKAVTSRVENSWGVGATYVTSAGDTALTIGGGLSGSEVAVLDTQSGADDGGFTIGVSAVTGDLTVAVGYADGDTTRGVGSNTNIQADADVVKAGIKYVTGDITMNLGMVSGTAVDNIFAGTSTAEDSHDEVNASVTYAVASGVSAILGYKTVEQDDEGTTDTTGGSSWYVGATMSF